MTAEPQVITFKIEIDGDVEQALRGIVREEIAADRERSNQAGNAFLQELADRRATLEGSPA